MRVAVVAIICVLFAGLAGAAEVGVSTRAATRIPAQDLGSALQALAKERDFHVIFVAEDVGGVRTQGVVGEVTADEALSSILNGTGLTYRYIDEKTVTIVPVGPSSSQIESRASAVPALMVAQGEEKRQSEPQAGENSSGSFEDQKLEEIVVTAQKRPERLQDVPLSITAVTAEEIDRRRLVSEEDYLRGIPGVNQVTDTIGPSIVIRGIETSPSNQNFSAGTTVATYFGETPTTNSAGLGGGANVDLKLVDIERVEVLRGPQGTAFGNSSLGGAVRTIPAAPKLDRPEGKVGINYSVTSGSGEDNNMMQAVGNLPLIENKLAIRAVAYRFEDSGFYRSVSGSNPALQARAATYGAQAFATNEDHVGSANFTGGRIAALFQASDDLKFSFGYLKQKTEVDGQAQAGTGAYDQALFQVAPEHVSRGQKGGVSDTDIDLANATMEYRFSWASLVATFSHIENDSMFTAPFAGFPASSAVVSEHRENSAEIRLATRLEGAWDFLGGLYAEELKDDFLQDAYWFGSAQSNIFGTSRFLGLYSDQRDLKQKAAFGEASWRFLRNFTLTGGVRAYDYERTGQVNPSGLFGVTPTAAQGDASGNSFRGNLSYKPNDAALVYASWSQGFRLGKPQPGLAPGLCDRNSDGIVDGTNTTIEQTRSFESDSVDNYELGSKLTLLDRRLTIAADIFHIDWSGVPFSIRAPLAPTGCGLVYNANAGGAESEGVEVQANFFVTRAFRVDVGGSSVRAKLTENAPGVGGFDGDRLPGSPKVNGNLALQYEFNIGGHPAFVRADSTYVGTFFGNLQESVLTEAGGYVKLDASARVTVGNLDIDFFVRNLTNQDDFTFRGIRDGGQFFGYRLRPRTVGLQLGYSFGRDGT
jgi:outer membrane receptor protein involved in Fe transport